MPPRRTLLLLFGVAVVVRALFVLLEPATAPVADERTWTNWAVEALVTPRVHFSPFRTHMIFYPPLYPYFIAAGYALFGSLAAVKWAQVVVSALLAPALGRVAGRAFGEATGVVAAAVAAVYPELVWFAAHFWSETLFMALLWWGFERLLAADERPGTLAACAAGSVWGLAVLTRETPFYFLPVAALWLALGRHRAGTRKGAAFLLVALLAIAPWTYRNWIVFKAFIPVATAGGLNLYQGNAPLTRQQVYDNYEAIQGRVEQYRWARAQGIQAILDQQPWWIFEKLRDEMPNFWEADSQAVIHVKRGAYGWPVRPASAIAAAVVVLVPFLLALVGFVSSMARAPLGRPAWLLLAFLAYYNLIHVVTHGYARYRLPALPVVLIFAAQAWVDRGERLGPVPGSRKALAAGVGLALLLSVIASLRVQFNEPAFGRALPKADVGESPDEAQ